MSSLLSRVNRVFKGTYLIAFVASAAATTPLQAKSNPHLNHTAATSDWYTALSALCVGTMNFFRSYGIQILMVSILGGMAVYRREMSSNRVYLDHRGNPRSCMTDNGRDSRQKNGRLKGEVDEALVSKNKRLDNEAKQDGEDEEDDVQTAALDHLLEGAGRVWSGGPFLAVLLAVWAHFSHEHRHFSDESDNERFTQCDGTVDVEVSFISDDKKGAQNSESDKRDSDFTLKADVSEGTSPLEKEDKGDTSNLLQRKTLNTSIEVSSLIINTDRKINEQTSKKNIQSVVWDAARDWISFSSGQVWEKSKHQYFLGNLSTRTIRQALYKSGNSITKASRGAFLSRNEFCYALTSSISGDGAESKLPLLLPPDAQIYVLSFLHPLDVVTFACTNRQTRLLIDDYYYAEDEKGGSSGVTEDTNRNKGNEATVSTMPLSMSTLIWLVLWQRDYHWIVTEWNIGQQALQRSFAAMNRANHRWACPQVILSLLQHNNQQSHLASSSAKTMSMKQFYLYFSQTWLNYTIAGHCTPHSCLTGLHGHVFDITNFFESHPGSPETLVMQGGGRDATVFFEDVGHSVKARRLAIERLCVVVDRSCCETYNVENDDDNCKENVNNTEKQNYHNEGTLIRCRRGACGLIQVMMTPVPPATKSTSSLYSSNHRLSMPFPREGFNSLGPKSLSQNSNMLMPMIRSKPRRPGTLYHIRKQLDNEKTLNSQRAEQLVAAMNAAADGDRKIMGGIHVYFDPFWGRWMSWYLDKNFKAVYAIGVGSYEGENGNKNVVNSEEG